LELINERVELVTAGSINSLVLLRQIESEGLFNLISTAEELK